MLPKDLENFDFNLVRKEDYLRFKNVKHYDFNFNFKLSTLTKNSVITAIITPY